MQLRLKSLVQVVGSPAKLEDCSGLSTIQMLELEPGWEWGRTGTLLI